MDNKIVKQLLKKEGVVSVGVGHKISAGVDTGRMAVVIGVKKKKPLGELAAKDVIPKEIAGDESDVQEVGEIKVLTVVTATAQDVNTGRVRPCPGGCSVGNFRITAGTLGLWGAKGAEAMLVSNSHVLGGSPVAGATAGDAILQPGAYDHGQNPADKIAELDTFVPVKFISSSWWQMLLDWLFRRSPPTNLVDCAMAAPMDDGVVDRSIKDIGVLAGSGEPMLGLSVKKSGRTTGLTSGTVAQVDVTSRVDMGGGKTAVFTDQCMVMAAGFSAPGDSGSAIVTNSNHVVGLLFAGNETVTIFNRWSNVRSALGLSAP